MSIAIDLLKRELRTVDVEIEKLRKTLDTASTVRNCILDQMFEADTGFRLGGDAIFTPEHGGRREPRRVKILCRTSRNWDEDWWCKAQIYKKDGTLGKHEVQMISVKGELTQPED